MPLCGTGRVQRAPLQAREPSLSPIWLWLWEGPWRLQTSCSCSGELCLSQPSRGAPTRPDSERRPGCELGAMGKLWGSRGGGVWGTLARAPGWVGLAGLGMWL